MGRWLTGWLLALLMLQAPLSYAAGAGQVTVASESWKDYTQPDGQGLAWDILHMVYTPLGITLVVHSVPYTRATGLARRGEVDAFAGSYRNEISDGIFYPERHFDNDLVAALSLKDSPAPTLENLRDYRLAWLRGYQFQRYLPTAGHYREVSPSSDVLRMLRMRHADFYLDDLFELQQLVMGAEEPNRYKLTPLTKLPLYIGFSDNPRGRELADMFDERMGVLIADGSLRPVFERWNRAYPFD